MSLIQDQQRKDSGVKEPEIKPLKLPSAPLPAPVDPTQATPADNSLQGFAQVAGGKWQPELSLPDANPSSPTSLEPNPTSVTPADYYQTLTGIAEPTLTEQQQTPAPTFYTQPIFSKLQPNEIDTPEVTRLKLPSFYVSNPDNDNKLVDLRRTTDNTLKQWQQADVIAAERQAQAKLSNRGSLANVPEVDKPWQASPLGMFSDVLFGSQQAQKEANQGVFQPFGDTNPLENFGSGNLLANFSSAIASGTASFGRQGGGVGGALKYGLSVIPNVFGGAVSEGNKLAANALEKLGVQKEAAERFARDGFLGFLPDNISVLVPPLTPSQKPTIANISVPKPSTTVGYNWEQARKKNQILGALTGEPILDSNDPKESTLITGRVFFSPRRKPRQEWYTDPLGASIDILSQIVSPDPVGNAVGEAVVGKLVSPALRKLGILKPVNPSARVPTTNVEQGTATVVQTTVKPRVNIGSLGEATPTPTHLAAKVGIGNPSSKTIQQLPELGVRSYEQTLESLQTKYPGVLNEYKGKTWADLKEYTNNKAPNVDFSEYAAVGKPQIGVPKLSNDDLITAADELVAHKVSLGSQLEQLDEVFESNLDYGRRTVQTLEPRPISAEDALGVLEAGGKPNLLPKALDNLVSAGKLQPEAATSLKNADYDGLVRFANRSGEDIGRMLTEVVQEHNAILSNPATANRAIKPTEALTKLPDALYHGSAISDWQPNYNLSTSASRGELGSGLYLTKDADVATQYAKARMGENANPATLSLDIDKPGVYKVAGELTSTLDARANLSSATLEQLVSALPAEVQAPLKKSLSRGQQTYSGLLSKLESSLPKAGLDPTEDTLQLTQDILSSKLRELGYDSVYDAKSGVALALDNSSLKVTEKIPVANPSALEATLARYNADAHAAKYFPQRLSTNANLQDSTAKLLEQMTQEVDDKLAQVQSQLMQRQASEEITSVLPTMPQSTKPQSVQQALDELELPSVCNP